MKIFVPIKLTYDVSQLKFDASTNTPLLDACPRVIGDADKCALEEAIRLKEKYGAEVAAVTIGDTQEHYRIIKDAYAMGATAGYIIKISNSEELSVNIVAELLASLYQKTGPYDLIILGSGSSDTHSSFLGAHLSAKLGLPIITGVDKLTVEDDKVQGVSTMEDGTYTFNGEPPLIITVTSEANEPRIPTLRDILRSKRMPINEFSSEDLSVEISKIEITDVKRYVVERKRIKFEADDEEKMKEAVEKLIESLKKEGVI